MAIPDYEIVVVGPSIRSGFTHLPPGSRLLDPNLSYLLPQIPEIQIPIDFSHLESISSVSALDGAENLGEGDFRSDRKTDENGNQISPTITVVGATQRELNTAIQSVDAAPANPDLAPVFQNLNQNNISLKFEFDVSDNAMRGADGDITIVVVAATGQISPNSTVTIRINDDINRQNDLERVIAHELAHLIPIDGRIDPESNASERLADRLENKIKKDLFDGFEPISFLDQPDTFVAITGGTPVFGPNAEATGTDGDNFILSADYSNDTIWAGDGNDIILSGLGTDKITVGDVGTNLIFTTHGQTNGWSGLISALTIDTDDSLDNFNFEMSGDDLIITYGSNIDPLLDPNKVIIADFQESHFGSIRTNTDFLFSTAWYDRIPGFQPATSTANIQELDRDIDSYGRANFEQTSVQTARAFIELNPYTYGSAISENSHVDEVSFMEPSILDRELLNLHHIEVAELA